MTFPDERNLRTFALTGTFPARMPDNTLRETEYSLDILRAREVAHAEVVYHSTVLILQVL